MIVTQIMFESIFYISFLVERYFFFFFFRFTIVYIIFMYYIFFQRIEISRLLFREQ